MDKDLVIRIYKANKTLTVTSDERCRASSVLSLQVMAGALCSFNKPLPRNKQDKRTSCLKPAAISSACAQGQNKFSLSLLVMEGLWTIRQEAEICQMALKVLR